MKYALLALIIVSMPVLAATAFLQSQHMGTSVTGQSISICVYAYNGHQFERAIPIGQMCPMSVDVQ